MIYGSPLGGAAHTKGVRFVPSFQGVPISVTPSPQATGAWHAPVFCFEGKLPAVALTVALQVQVLLPCLLTLLGGGGGLVGRVEPPPY